MLSFASISYWLRRPTFSVKLSRPLRRSSASLPPQRQTVPPFFNKDCHSSRQLRHLMNRSVRRLPLQLSLVPKVRELNSYLYSGPTFWIDINRIRKCCSLIVIFILTNCYWGDLRHIAQNVRQIAVKVFASFKDALLSDRRVASPLNPTFQRQIIVSELNFILTPGSTSCCSTNWFSFLRSP